MMQNLGDCWMKGSMVLSSSSWMWDVRAVRRRVRKREGRNMAGPREVSSKGRC